MFPLPAELERGTVAREVDVVDRVVTELAEEIAGCRIQSAATADRRRARVQSRWSARRRREFRRSCRARARGPDQSRWCARGTRPGCRSRCIDQRQSANLKLGMRHHEPA